MKKLFLALCLVPGVVFAGDPPKFTLTEAQANDYAFRLRTEMAQLKAKFEEDSALLEALLAQTAPPKKADKKGK